MAARLSWPCPAGTRGHETTCAPLRCAAGGGAEGGPPRPRRGDQRVPTCFLHRRGEIWTYDFARPDKRRPVLVLSRDEALAALHTVIVAPITSTRHGSPAEVSVGPAEGLKHDSAVNLDHVQCVERSRLSKHVGRLSEERMRQVCRALAIATGCAD